MRKDVTNVEPGTIFHGSALYIIIIQMGTV